MSKLKTVFIMSVILSYLIAPCFTLNKQDMRLLKAETTEIEEIPIEENEIVSSDHNSSQENTIKVMYDFVELAKLDGGNLSEKLINLIPETEYVSDLSEVKLPSYDAVENYTFVGWEPGVRYEDGSVLYFGVWSNKDESTPMLRSIPRPDRPADKRITSSGAPVGIPGSGAPHQQLDGIDAYCYEPYVTGYANPTHSYWHINTINNKAAAIIGMGQLNGMPYGAIQAALWNYLTGGSYSFQGYDVNPDSNVYSRNGLYDCTAEVYASYVTDTGAVQDLIISKGCTMRMINGSLKIKKSANQKTYDYINISPNNYSLAGAQYGVYSDQACTSQIATLETAKDGTTPDLQLNEGTYYVKELKASPGFKLDTNVHSVYVSAGNTATVNSLEDPIETAFDLTITKLNARDNSDTSHLDEAEFTLRYYDSQNKNISNSTPKYTWIFKPIIVNGKADIKFDKAHLLKADKIHYSSNNNMIMPLGVFTLHESKAPQGFAIDPKVYVGQVSNVNSSGQISIDVSGWMKADKLSLTQYEQLKSVSIAVEKIDEDTNSNKPQGLATLKNAEFKVYKYNNKTNDKDEIGIIKTDDKGYGLLDKGKDGLSLLPGKYYIEEIKAPDGYILSDEIIEIDATVSNNDINTVHTIKFKNKATTLTVNKIDSNGEFVENAKLEILNKDNKAVYSWISDGKPHEIRGLVHNETYTLHEVSTDSKYALAEDITFKVDEDHKQTIEMVDGIIAINTSASFKESGTKNYVADGMAHVVDNIRYEWLYPGKTYLIKGQLIDKGTKDNPIERVVRESKLEFVPEEKHGFVQLEFRMNFDNYDEHDFVIYEDLYIIEKTDDNKTKETFVTCHRDYNNNKQTVHVDKLYRAAMVLYKVGETKDVRLDGAIFSVKTKRTKRDGAVTEKNLGRYVSGGIYHESKDKFTFEVFKDTQLGELIYTVDSDYNHRFQREYVMIMNLPEGTYYGRIKGEDQIYEYKVERGMIFLKDQPENTEITYTELAAPNGYYLNPDPYVVNVGNDDSLTRINNYRPNVRIVAPRTVPRTGV